MAAVCSQCGELPEAFCNCGAPVISEFAPTTASVTSTAYGYCPTCGKPGARRERRPNGDDTCIAGHVYPSAQATKTPRPPYGVIASGSRIEKTEPAPTGRRFPMCIVVEDQPTADAMQKFVDPEHVRFIIPFQALGAPRFTAIFVRWPSPAWFERRCPDQQRFQDWVRDTLMHRKLPGADFQYI